MTLLPQNTIAEPSISLTHLPLLAVYYPWKISIFFFFKGLKPEFNDISMTLQAQIELVTFDDLQYLLLTCEYMQSSKATSLKPIAFFYVSGSELITKPFLEPTTYPDFSLTQLAYIYGLLQFSPQQSSPSLFHIAQILFARHGTQSSSTQYSGGLCGHGGG